MSAFCLKLIAVAAMFIDHLAYTLSLSGLYPPRYIYMRAVGRLAFPIFAFMLVNGLAHTRSRVKYLLRMAAFALISQPFFALAFSSASYSAAPFSVFKLLSPSLNIFFTLAVSLAVIAALDALYISAHTRQNYFRALGLFALAMLAAGLILPRSDYGYMGLVLIAALYFTRQSRIGMAAVIVLWSFAEYAMPLTTWQFVAFAALAGVLTLLYNGERGAKARWIYAFYPLHLAALWALCYAFSR